MEDLKGSRLNQRERKILKELDINARQSVSALSEKLGISKPSVNYNIENMQKQGYIKEFITYFDTNKLGYTFYNIIVKLKYMSKDDKDKIIKGLKKIKNVVWCCSFTGEWQLIVSILARNVGEFSRYLDEVLSVLKGGMLDYTFFVVLSASQLGYKKIHTKAKGKHHFRIEHSKVSDQDKVDLSENDLKIARTLANNARMSLVDIAKKNKMTVRQVRHSLKKLEDEKVVQGYKPLINVSRLGHLWHIMFLRLKSCPIEEKEEMIEFLKAMPEVCYVVRGVGNCNLMVEFHTESVEEFEKVKDKISRVYNKLIAYERSVLVTEEHKCTYFPGSMSG